MRERITHGHLALAILLVIAVGLSGWYWQQSTDARLVAIDAQLREALTPKQAGEDPTRRRLPPS